MNLEPLAPSDYPDVQRVDTARGHHYVHGGKRVRNVTTIIGGAVPKMLTGWASRLAAERSFDLLQVNPEMSRDDLVKAASGASNEARDSAARRGTTVHEFAEQILRGEDPDVPDDLRPWTDGVERFLDDTGWRTFATEVIVWNDDPMYAGTVDGLMEDVRGGIRCVDFKAGKGIYADMALQLAAYKYAKWLRIGEKVYRMPPIASTGLIHLPGDGTYDYWAANANLEAFEVFCSAYHISGWLAQKKEEVVQRWELKPQVAVER